MYGNFFHLLLMFYGCCCSVAILKYLADKHQVADHWYPKDLQSRAKVDCFMSWQHLNLRLGGALVFRIQASHIVTEHCVQCANFFNLFTDGECMITFIGIENIRGSESMGCDVGWCGRGCTGPRVALRKFLVKIPAFWCF